LKRLGTIAVIALMTVAAAGQESLPPGPGQTLVLETCVQCHDVRAIVTQRKSESAWRRTVNEMIWRGAALMPGEADVLTKYLVTEFGEQRGAGFSRRSWEAKALPAEAGATSPDRFAKYLPPGLGRALVVAACAQCHDLGVTVMQRKTADAWKRSVEQMARLGARLNGSELQIVTNYLSGAFGPDRPMPPEIRKGAS